MGWAITWAFIAGIAVTLIFRSCTCAGFRQMAARVECAWSAEKKESEITKFAEQNAPEIRRALRDVLQMEADLNQRLQELGTALKIVGDTPTDDADYNEWSHLHEQVVSQRVSLERALAQAYIAKKKFDLAPSEDGRRQVEQILRGAMQMASDIQERYAKLKAPIAAVPPAPALVCTHDISSNTTVEVASTLLADQTNETTTIEDQP